MLKFLTDGGICFLHAEKQWKTSLLVISIAILNRMSSRDCLEERKASHEISSKVETVEAL